VKVLAGLNPLLIFCDEPLNQFPSAYLFIVAEMLAALCWIRMPQLRHIASALGVPCSSFRCVVQWPYSVSVACGYVREPGETGFIYGLQRLIPSAIYSVVWLQEREKLIDKDVEENGRVLIGGTIPVSSYTD
jgi:hypothetical protein